MTRQQWFETLPAPYAERAIANTRRHCAGFLDHEASDLRSAIGGGFEWFSTAEGPDFWRDVAHGSLPPIPGEEAAAPESVPAPDPEPAEPMYRYFRYEGGSTEFRVLAGGSENARGWRRDIGSQAWRDSTMCRRYILNWGANPPVEFFPDAEQAAPAPEYHYFRSRVSRGVWRMPASGSEIGEFRLTPTRGWARSRYNTNTLIAAHNPIPCDESGNPVPVAVPVAGSTTLLRLRPGYRYRTRGGLISGYLQSDPDNPDYPFVDPLSLQSFRFDGAWIDDTPHNEDLVEEITPTTIEEWLHTIPESEAALQNAESQQGSWYHRREDRCGSTHDAVSRGFSWLSSPEGIRYWENVHVRLAREFRSLHPAIPVSYASITPAPPPPAPAPPPPAKVKYRITEVRHYFLEAEDEIEADRLFRNASNPERTFRFHTEDREIHNDA